MGQLKHFISTNIVVLTLGYEFVSHQTKILLFKEILNDHSTS